VQSEDDHDGAGLQPGYLPYVAAAYTVRGFDGRLPRHVLRARDQTDPVFPRSRSAVFVAAAVVLRLAAPALSVPADKFFDSLSSILLSAGSPFFEASTPRYCGQAARSADCEACSKVFATGALLQRLEQALAGALSIHRIYVVFSLVSFCRNLFDQRQPYVCAASCVSVLVAKVLNQKRESLREVDEKEVNSIFGYLTGRSYIDVLNRRIEEVRIHFNIDLVKSTLKSHSRSRCTIGRSLNINVLA
jgi:hypothetical protein